MQKQPFIAVSMSVLLTLIMARHLNWKLCAVLSVIAFLGSLISVFFLPCSHRTLSIVLLSVACALGLFAIRFVMYVQPVAALEGVSANISGTVIDEPSFTGEKFVYKLRIDNVVGENISNFKTVKTSYSDLDLSAFDNVSGDVVFYSDEYETYRSENIFIRAYVDASGDGLTASCGEKTLYYYAISARKAVRSAISELVNGDAGALITAVLIGDRGGMAASTLDSVRTSGISHITVVSGLHLSILVNLMLTVFGTVFRSRRIAAAATLPCVLAIMALAGFSPSVVRSGITCTIYLLGTVILKRSKSLNSLCIAALIQCLLNPFVIYSVSFLLSAFSTLGIILLEPPMRNFVLGFSVCRFRAVRRLAKATVFSLSAQLMTLPIVIITYGYVTPFSVVTNLIIGLPVTLLVCLSAVGALLCISGVFGYLGNFAMLAAGLDAKLILFVADIMSRPDFSKVYITSFSAMLVFAAICLLLALCLIFPKPFRLRHMALLITLAVSVGCLQYSAFESGTVTITSLVTKNGAAVLIRDKDYTAAIGSTADSYYARNMSEVIKYSCGDDVELIILPENCEQLSGAAPDLLRNVTADKIIYNDKRIDIMKLEGTERMAYGECKISMTDRVSAEICNGYISVTVYDTEIIIPTAAVKTPVCDIIISPPEFITTTSHAKYAIISGSAPVALAAGYNISENGTTSYVVGDTRSLNLYIRGDHISFGRYE